MDDAYQKWAERANKIGTLAELIVSPGIPEIAREYFGDDDFDFFGHQIQKRNMKDRSLRRDFDIVAATEKNFFVINTTSHPDLSFHVKNGRIWFKERTSRNKPEYQPSQPLSPATARQEPRRVRLEYGPEIELL